MTNLLLNCRSSPSQHTLLPLSTTVCLNATHSRVAVACLSRGLPNNETSSVKDRGWSPKMIASRVLLPEPVTDVRDAVSEIERVRKSALTIMTREEPPFALLDRPIHLIQHLPFFLPFTRPSIRDVHPLELDQRLSRPCGRSLGTGFLLLAPDRALPPLEPFLFEGGPFCLARFKERLRFRRSEDLVFGTEEEAVVRSVDVDVGEREMGHKGGELVLRSEDEEDTR